MPDLAPDPVVIGSLMELTPAAARPHLDRLRPDDFTDQTARLVFELITGMVTAEVPSLDPVAVFGYAQRTGTVTGEHRLSRLGTWLATTYPRAAGPAALSYFTTLLIEAAYRRAVLGYATRLTEATTAGLAALDRHRIEGAEELTAIRARLNSTALTTPVSTHHPIPLRPSTAVSEPAQQPGSNERKAA